MKKLVFLFAMMLAVVAAMAQNQSAIDQNGNSNEALIKQIGAEDNAEILQNGNSNDADVLQSGSSNEAYVAQGMIAGYLGASRTTNAMTANRNEASVEQVGNGNKVGEIVQIGNDNVTSVEQSGDDNEAHAYQGWAYRFWGETYTTSHLSSTNSFIDISQIGSENSGKVWQYGGNNNTAKIDQNGNNNTASFVQGWIYTDLAYDFYNIPVFNTNNNIATAIQNGNGNFAKNIQLGSNNIFKLTQNNNNNSVGYKSDATNLLDSRNNYFVQDGSNNTFAGVWKSSSDALYESAGADAEQNNGATLDVGSFQRGNSNYIGLRQGMDDWALIQQDGISNSALLWQQGAPVNEATIMQTGNSNVASVFQTN